MTPYTIREPIFEHKHVHKGYTIEIKVYKVPKDNFHPEGFQYSLALVKNGKRILGYDNHERKGHHIHKGKKEVPYDFADEWRLVEDFMNDVKKATKGEIR